VAKTDLGLLKQTSIIIHDREGLERLALMPGIKHTISARRSEQRANLSWLIRNGRLIGRHSFHPCRSFFVVTPVVRGLNVVWIVVTPCSAHSFRVPVVGHDVIIVRELFVADGADATCRRILRFSSFRISAGDRSSRYPRG